MLRTLYTASYLAASFAGIDDIVLVHWGLWKSVLRLYHLVRPRSTGIQGQLADVVDAIEESRGRGSSKEAIRNSASWSALPLRAIERGEAYGGLGGPDDDENEGGDEAIAGAGRQRQCCPS
jgi:hypothetical protein